MLPSIHASNFLSELFQVLNSILIDPVKNINLLVECVMEGNRYRSLAPSMHIASGFSLTDLENHFNERIDNFEAQSGSGEEGASVIGTRAIITNITSAPNPSVIPFSSDPANIQWKTDTKIDRKAARRPSASVQSISNLQSQITNLSTSMDNMTDKIVQAINSQSPKQPSIPSIFGSVNWTPIIQGMANVVVTSLGGSTNFPHSAQVTGEVQNNSSLETRLNHLESKITSLESTLNVLAKSQTNMTNSVSSLAQTLETFIKASTPSISNKPNGNSSNSNSYLPFIL